MEPDYKKYNAKQWISNNLNSRLYGKFVNYVDSYTYNDTMAEEPEMREAPIIFKALPKQIKWAERLLNTPLLPNEYLSDDVLFLLRLIVKTGEYDEDEALLDFLTNPKGRNWAYILADDGSFTYENWRGRNRGIADDGSFTYENFRGRNRKQRGHEDSESHPFGAYGGVIAVQNYILGVQPMAPAYARMQIRPHLLDLDYAKGTVPTQRGEVTVNWQRKDGNLRLAVTIPANTTATVHVPTTNPAAVTESGKPAEKAEGVKFLRAEKTRAVYEIGSGSYVFEAKNLSFVKDMAAEKK